MLKDTNYLNFSLRERFWLNTKVFDPDTPSTTEPGQTIRLAVDPFSALISSNQDVHTGEIRHYASQLALTLSRFREFRYVGTKVAVVPAATSVAVDPAHISADYAGTNNYMHPRDTNNMMHWRRWLGGNIRVPSVRPTGADGKYTAADSYDLDSAWMSDVRYNHVPISQGFETFVAPKRATLQIGAGSMVSLLGIWSEKSIGGKEHGTEAHWQTYGQTALSTGEVVEDGWVPNPFAGFQYDWIDELPSGWPQTGNEIPYVVSYNPLFPWFGDVVNLATVANTPSINALIDLIRERFLAPLCILRLPPAYGSSYYFTVYLRHFFSVRKPYLVNGVWVAAKVQRFTPSPVPGANGLRMLAEVPDVDDDYHIVQSISPDPYAGGDDTSVMSMDDLASNSIWQMSLDDVAAPEDEVEEEKKEEKKKE